MSHTDALVTEHRSLDEIEPWLQRRLEADGLARLRIPDPDDGEGLWPGEPRPDGAPRRDWRAWLDLADAVGARMRTPRSLANSDPPALLLTLVRLSDEAELHRARTEVRYRTHGPFARIHKHHQPGFRFPLIGAVRFAGGAAAPRRVLVAGCHRGDELEVLTGATLSIPEDRITGLDRDDGALLEARRRFPAARFVKGDLGSDGPLSLDLSLDRAGERFDLIVIVDVLQSPDLDGPAVLRRLVADHAASPGGLVVGLPASRFRDGEVVWGARTRNFTEVDLSLLIRDLAGHRRYLHQHGYRTRIGGRYDLLLAARRERER